VIARAVRLAQTASPTTSLVLLVAFNLVPLVGVLAWGWNVATLLVLYWVENGIVGILNVPKMLLAAAPETGTAGPRITPAGVAFTKGGQVVFFLMHYGIFWLVHGVFVWTLPSFASAVTSMPAGLGDGSFPTYAVTPVGPDVRAVALGAIGLGISRTASFALNFVGRSEYLQVSTTQQMFAPYGRLLILHLTILFGAFVSLAIGSPVGAIVVLVLVKTAIDLGLHVREHAATRDAEA